MKNITIYKDLRLAVFVCVASLSALTTPALHAQGRGGAAPEPPPSGPMAPEKYKNIQVLTNVPADQIEVTMRYVSAAVGMPCAGCHVQNETGQFEFDKDDKRAKQTGRQMMKMLYSMNAANYGINIQCATCHQGHNQPAGLSAADMITPEQAAQMQAQMQAMAAPQGPGRGNPGQGGQGGGQNAQAPAQPQAADVISKYLDAIGGRPAVEKLQSLTLTGSLTDRTGQTSTFTIEEKGNKFRDAEGAVMRGFDGTAGWSKNGANVRDLAGFSLDQALRLNDLGNPATINSKYSTLQAGGRPTRIDGKNTVTLTGRAGIVTEQYYFDSDSGLLLRRVVNTRTVLGQLREQIDYTDYRPVNGVKIPFGIKVNDWQTLNTLKVSDAKANTVADADFARPR